MVKSGMVGAASILAVAVATFWSVEARAGNVLTVTSSGDGLNGPGCTLRMAVSAANNGSSNACGQGTGNNDTIQLGGSGATAITLTPSLGAIQITKSMVIQGNFHSSHPDYTTVSVSTTGSALLQIPSSSTGVNLTLQWLRLTGAQGSSGNGGCLSANGTNGVATLNVTQIDHCSAHLGGAIYSTEPVVITSSFFHDNQASFGGALEMNGVPSGDPGLTVNRSTFSNNKATSGSGGGVYTQQAHVEFYGTTFDSNSASANGGGLYVTSGGGFIMTNDTFGNNTAGMFGGGIYFDGEAYWEVNNITVAHNSAGQAGGGLYLTGANGTTYADGNNIFAYNSAAQGPDVSGNAQFFGGGGPDILTNPSGNTPPLGQSGAVYYTPWFVADPVLGTLQSVNGLPKVYPLLLGSPAIDAGTSSLSYDERGACRPITGYGDNLPDIGAFEFDPASIYTVVSLNSGMALDDPGFSSTPGTQMDQWTVNNGSNQQWQLGLLWTQRTGTAILNIMNHFSSLQLSVRGGSNVNGAPVDQEVWQGFSSQQWWLLPSGTGSGYFTLSNVQSGQLLDVVGASKNPGALIEQWPSNGGANQKWTFLVAPAALCSGF